MRSILFSLLFVLSTTLAQAQDFTFEITAVPPNPAPGDLVILSSNAPPKSPVVWILGNANKSILPVNEATQCVFASGQKGEYIFFAICWSQNKLHKAQTVVQIGESIPEPDDPPGPDPNPDDPDVPPDDFDNIGQRVAQWSNGLPKRKEVGAVYRKAANGLEEGKYISIPDAAEDLVKNRTNLLSSDASKWEDFAEKLNKDFRERQPLARQLTVEYWEAIATGLGG